VSGGHIAFFHTWAGINGNLQFHKSCTISPTQQFYSHSGLWQTLGLLALTINDYSFLRYKFISVGAFPSRATRIKTLQRLKRVWLSPLHSRPDHKGPSQFASRVLWRHMYAKGTRGKRAHSYAVQNAPDFKLFSQGPPKKSCLPQQIKFNRGSNSPFGIFGPTKIFGDTAIRDLHTHDENPCWGYRLTFGSNGTISHQSVNYESPFTHY